MNKKKNRIYVLAYSKFNLNKFYFLNIRISTKLKIKFKIISFFQAFRWDSFLLLDLLFCGKFGGCVLIGGGRGGNNCKLLR